MREGMQQTLWLAVSSACLNKESRTSEEDGHCRGRNTEERLEHKHLPQSSCFPLPPGTETALQTPTHTHWQTEPFLLLANAFQCCYQMKCDAIVDKTRCHSSLACSPYFQIYVRSHFPISLALFPQCCCQKKPKKLTHYLHLITLSSCNLPFVLWISDQVQPSDTTCRGRRRPPIWQWCRLFTVIKTKRDV